MTTDRELLELAAKAAGLGDVWYLDGSDTPYVGDKYELGGPVKYSTFRPLTDDGDALHLMVRLNLLLKECCNSEECYPQGYGRKKVIEFFIAQGDRASQMAAARRAIVRAAAAIGAKS